jgi:capsular polysaccharide biosynthesis protein
MKRFVHGELYYIGAFVVGVIVASLIIFLAQLLGGMLLQ